MPKDKPNTYLVLIALWLMVFSSSSQVIIIAPILPRIGEALAVSESLLGLLGTSYALLLSLFAIITGPISDKFGRRRILLMGCGFMAGALALHGLANTFWVLLTVRGLAGAGGGILSGAAVAYVGDYFPYERRGWANGWIMSGIAVGQILGIPLGTILAVTDFRVPFLVFAGTMGVAWLLVWFFVPQPDVQRDPHPLSIKRALLNYGRLMKVRAPAMAVLSFLLMFVSFGFFVFYLPTWLEQDVGLSGTEVASLFFVGGLANVVVGPLAGRVSDRIGRKPLVVTACLGLGLVMFSTTYIVFNLWMAYLMFTVAMILVAMRTSPLQALMTAIVPDEQRGILLSLAIAVGQVGFGLGSAMAGLTFTQYGYLSNTILAATAIVLMAMVVRFFLPEPALEPASGSLPSDVAKVAKAS